MKTIKQILKYTLAALVVVVMAAWVLPTVITSFFKALLFLFTNPVTSLVAAIAVILVLVIADRKANK